MVIKRSTWISRAIAEVKKLEQNQLLIPNVAFSSVNYLKIVEKNWISIFNLFS